MSRVQIPFSAAHWVRPHPLTVLVAAITFAVVSDRVVPTCEGALVLTNPTEVIPVTPTITFSEVGLGTPNPVYSFSSVDLYADLTISFASHFEGQVLGSAPNSLLDTRPDSPLALALGGPLVATSLDLANPTMPGLGGLIPAGLLNIYFSTPIAIHFDTPVNAVLFDLGHLDGPGTSIVEAFDAAGNSLGTVPRSQLGFETIGLSDTTGNHSISGVSVYVAPGHTDLEGITIDNVRVGQSVHQTPEPGACIIWALLAASGIVVWFWRRPGGRC